MHLSLLLRWQPHPIHDLPLLRIRYPRRVQPVGQLIGRPRRVMSHKGGREVLRGAFAFTLGDEPLAGGVEYAALEVRVELPKFGIALGYFSYVFRVAL